MKKIFLTLVLIFTSASLFAGNNDKIIKDTTINKVVYHIYQGNKGGKYILKTSQKTGKTYKQYLKH